MCGRYVSASPPDELARYFSATLPEETIEESYNVAPTTSVYAVRSFEGSRALTSMRWGLVPFWAKDVKIGSKMINARSETAPSKPAFRRAFAKRRCILPADGFYEWQKVAGQQTKQPFFIHRDDDEPLAFAGLYEDWYPKDEDGNDIPDADPLTSCTILTTEANEAMAAIHDRMPVMLPPRVWGEWLDEATDASYLRSLLVPAPASLLRMRPIATAVNNVRNNGPELIDPVERVTS